MDESKRFASPEEEIRYWRLQAEKFKQEYEETKEDFEEFQISSRELEAEMETQMEQLENRNREFASNNSKLSNELSIIKEKLEFIQGTSHKQVSELEDELAEVRAFKDELTKYIRELEQANDDLERAKRATVVSLEDFESRLNQAIERNAFLESELDEKETLMETVQRLRDESRDLKQELSVRTVTGDHLNGVSPTEGSVRKRLDSGPRSPDAKESSSNSLKQRLRLEPRTPDPHSVNNSFTSSVTTPTNSLPSLSGGTGTPLTPSARISALNIVGDLLRKVGALETKLASCRNFVKDQPRSGKPGSGTSPSNSPRSKRLNRGTSVPPSQEVLDFHKEDLQLGVLTLEVLDFHKEDLQLGVLTLKILDFHKEDLQLGVLTLEVLDFHKEDLQLGVLTLKVLDFHKEDLQLGVLTLEVLDFHKEDLQLGVLTLEVLHTSQMTNLEINSNCTFFRSPSF
ncbi:hypothetical protein ScPMuIL_004919 [Solemya velum]